MTVLKADAARALLLFSFLGFMTGSAIAGDPKIVDSIYAPKGGAVSTPMVEIATTCLAPTKVAVENLPAGIDMPASISMDTPCPNADTPGHKDDQLSCDNKKSLLAWRKANKNAIAGRACQLQKIGAMISEMSCLKNAINQMTTDISTTQSQLEPLITQTKTDMDAMGQQLQDRTDQMADVVKRLNGDDSIKQPGLIAIRDKLTALSNKQLLDAADLAKKSATTLTARKIGYSNLLNQYKMSLAISCFKSKVNPRFTCVTDGPPVSAEAYLLCRHEQNGVGKFGGDQRVGQAAKGQSAALASTIDSMLGDGPNLSHVPAPEEPVGHYDFSSPDDVLGRYGLQLSTFNISGMPAIKTFVSQAIKGCYSTVSDNVDKMAGDSSTAVGHNIQAIDDQISTESTRMKSDIMNAAQAYTEAIKGNTSLELPMDTSGCLQGTIADKASCLQALSNAVTTVLNGKVTVTNNDTPLTRAALKLTNGQTPVFAFNQTLTATDPKRAVNIQCQGVNGCIASLQSVQTQLQTSIKTTTKMRNDYATAANSRVTNAAATLGANFSRASTVINLNISKLEKAMAMVGASGSLKLTPKVIDPASLQPNVAADANGGPKTYGADQIENLILSKVKPRLLTTDGDGFSDAQKAITDAKTKVAEELNSFSTFYSGAEAQYKKCVQEDLEKPIATANDDLVSLEGVCKGIPMKCASSPAGTLTSTVQQITDKLDPGSGLNLDNKSFYALENGVKQYCRQVADSVTCVKQKLGSCKDVDPSKDPVCHDKITKLETECDKLSTMIDSCNNAYDKFAKDFNPINSFLSGVKKTTEGN